VAKNAHAWWTRCRLKAARRAQGVVQDAAAPVVDADVGRPAQIERERRTERTARIERDSRRTARCEYEAQVLVANKAMNPVWQPAYIGVGSNLDDPRAQVLKAVDKLREISGGTTRVIALSKLYGSKPFGPVAQGDFVNAVVGILTQLDSPALLKETRAIERTLGRPEKYQRWGPRIIDLDLLVFGRETRADPDLTLPHPGIVERNWVLYPLADIAPDLDIPGLGRVAALKGNIAPEGLWLL
jgi:2-amino-4-hydroxy-6-hydroxymethyldihydropteridine diphosphokinase